METTERTIMPDKMKVDKFGQITYTFFINEENRFKKIGYLECMKKLNEFREFFQESTLDTQQVLTTLHDYLFQGINEI